MHLQEGHQLCSAVFDTMLHANHKIFPKEASAYTLGSLQL